MSARPAGGSWATLGTIPLEMDGLSSSRAYRYGDIAVDVPLGNEPAPPSGAMGEADCRFEDAAEKVIGATVRVVTDRGAGTAFYAGDSQFVTAAHVVAGAREIRLHSSGMDAPARVLGAHDVADIALLSAPAGELEPLDFAAPGAIRTDARPGAAVAAAGYADGMGEDAAITRGIVSRLFTRASVSWLQTDAALSPGASGGPLFDVCGRVVGVISSKVISEGVEGMGFGVAEPSLGQVLLNIRNDMRYGPGPDWEQIDAFVKNFGDEQRRVLFESINALMEQWNDVWPTETRPSERLAGIARAQHALATQAWTFVQAIPAAYPLALTNERGGALVPGRQRLPRRHHRRGRGGGGLRPRARRLRDDAAAAHGHEGGAGRVRPRALRPRRAAGLRHVGPPGRHALHRARIRRRRHAPLMERGMARTHSAQSGRME